MPRTTQQIIEHAEELAARFESMDPVGEPEVTPLGELYLAVQERAKAQRLLDAKVNAARKAGCSWLVIGQMLGTSDEAARQRYGNSAEVPAIQQAVPRAAPSSVAAKAPAKSTKRTTGKSPKGTTGKQSAKGTTGKQSAKGTTGKSAKGAATRGRSSR